MEGDLQNDLAIFYKGFRALLCRLLEKKKSRNVKTHNDKVVPCVKTHSDKQWGFLMLFFYYELDET